MAEVLKAFAEVDLNDHEDYHGGHKEPRVVEWLDIHRGCSDRSGQIQNLQFGAVYADTDHYFRGMLDDPTRKYLTNRPYEIDIIDDDDRRQELEPMIVANGFVGDYSPEQNLRFRINGHDWIKRKFTRRARSNESWQPRITLQDFPNAKGTITTDTGVIEYSNVGKIIPIIYGRITDTNLITPGDPLSDYGDGQFKPIYVGDYELSGSTWRGALVAAHYCKLIEAGFVLNNPVDLENDPDWLTPVNSSDWGAAGFVDDWVTINGRDYCMIFVKGEAGDYFCGKTPVPSDLTGSEPMTINVWGRTDNGDDEGILLSDGFDQYQDFLRNYVCPDTAWASGQALDIPVFPMISNLHIINTASFETCKQIAELRVGGGYELNFVLGANNQNESILDIIAEFNKNLDCQHYWNRRGQFALTMEPEGEDSALDPINDIVDINKDSLKIVDQVAQDFFNVLPFRHTYDYVGRMQRDLNADWRSEMRGDVERRHTSSIANYEQEREASTYEFRFIRGRNRMEDSPYYDQGTATVEDVMMRLAARYADPQRIVTLTGVYNLLPYECGDVFALSSIEGIGATGWSGRMLRILNHTVSPSRGQVTLVCYDLRTVIDNREELTTADGSSPLGSPEYSPPVVGGSPVVEEGDDVVITIPGWQDLLLVGRAPTITVQVLGDVPVPAGAVALSGLAATLLIPALLPVPVGALVLSGAVSTVDDGSASLPTTNRTFHLDASDTDRLWKETGMTNHPADGEAVVVWDDEGDATNFAMIATTGNGPAYSATGFNGIGCLDFDGTNDVLLSRTDNNGAIAALSNFITNNAAVIFVSFIMEGDAASSATLYDNDALLGDTSEFMGLYLRTSGGVHTLTAFNWDGSADYATVTISQNTKYVVCWKHVGGTVSIDVNNGALTASAASGNTGNLAFQLAMGRGHASNVNFFTGKIGEIAIYNTDVTGTDLSDAWSYFMSKWT